MQSGDVHDVSKPLADGDNENVSHGLSGRLEDVSLEEKVFPRGRGVVKWRKGEGECPLAGSRGPCYMKQELLDVRDVLQREGRIVVPSEAQIPITLQKGGPRLGFHEMNCIEWIWIAAEGPPYFALTKKGVHEKIDNGEMAPDDLLLPMRTVHECGIRADAFRKLFEEQNIAKTTNRRSAAKEATYALGSRPAKRFVPVDWHKLSESLSESNAIFYMDSSENVQGPFDKKPILQWWRHGLFPERLRIRNSVSDRFVQMHMLMAKWLATKESWVLYPAMEMATLTRQEVIARFLSGELSMETKLLPLSFHQAKRPIPVLFLIVHWLPFCERWLVKEHWHMQTMSVPDAFQFWLTEYGTQTGYLNVRPEVWTTDIYIPIENLMESYGYVE